IGRSPGRRFFQSKIANRRSKITDGLDEFAGEAALADAGTTGEGDNPSRFAGGRAEAGEDLVRPFAAGQEAEQPAESEAVALAKAFKETVKHRSASPPAGARSERRRSRAEGCQGRKRGRHPGRGVWGRRLRG